MPAARTIRRSSAKSISPIPDDVKVTANNHAGEVLVHLGSSNYLERYKIYVTHLQEWQQQFDKLESVDLRYDRQIIVNPDLQGPMKQAAALRRSGQESHGGRSEAGRADHPHQHCSQAISDCWRVKPLVTAAAKPTPSKPAASAKTAKAEHRKATRPTGARPRARPEQRQSTLAAPQTARRQKPRPAPKSVAAVKRCGETEPGNCQGRNTIGMANQHEHLLTAIDVGSAKTCALVAEITDNGLRYRGHGVAESRGSRKGVIVDLDKAVTSIQKAVEQAEDVAGAPIEHALLGMAGAHARGFNSHGGLSFGARAREIGREELRAAVDKARAIPLPDDREILHLLPQEFILDDQTGVNDPLGMMAARLEVRVHMVTVASSALQNVVTAVNRAGVHVDDTVFEPLACADAVLRADERELGVCLADLGAGSTSIIVFQEGAVAHTGVIPIGGDHFTSDLSVGLCTPVAEAEKIKRLYGNAIVTLIPEGNEVEVPSVGDRPSRLISQRMVGEILEPRARELFEMLRDNLRHAGMFELCVGGIVLTGGGCRLPGILEIAESVLHRPLRLAWPAPLAKMPSTLAEPEFATVLGMVFYGHRARIARGIQNERWSSRLKAMFVGKGA